MHRLQLRYRGLTRKDGVLPSQEEILLAMAEGVDENYLTTWLIKRRTVCFAHVPSTLRGHLRAGDSAIVSDGSWAGTARD